MSKHVRNAAIEAEESSKREEILKAAERSFLARGYRGTSMELVAKDSGAGRQTVYNQFASKRALFDATLARLWERMPIDHIVSRNVAERSPELILLEIGSTIAEFWVKEEAVAFLRMIICESVHFPELAESFFTFGQGTARRSIIECLIVLGEKKALRLADSDLAAAQFIGLINEPLLSSRIIGAGKSPSKERRKQVVNEAVQTFLARYGAA